MYTSLSYVNAIPDKYISSSVDCGYWNGYFGATLSLIDVNELLRLANYKPAAHGRTQKKNRHITFFLIRPLPYLCETVVATLNDRLYVHIHWHAEAVHIRCIYRSGYVSAMSFLVHDHRVYFGCRITHEIVNGPPPFHPARKISGGRFITRLLWLPPTHILTHVYTARARVCTQTIAS